RRRAPPARRPAPARRPPAAPEGARMSGLSPADRRRFDHAVALSRAPTARKILARPLRMLGSKAMEHWCRPRATILRRTARSFWGEAMLVVLPELVSLTICRYGYFEEELTHIFLEVLRPGMTFFDVGGHFGFFSMLALRLVGPQGCVVAFEPTHSTREVLE